MQVTVIRPFLDKTGVRTEGEVIDIPEMRAKELEQNGLIIPSVGAKHVVGRTTVNKAVKGTGVPAHEVDPTTARPTGGQTGAEKPASLSEEVQPQPKRTYRRRRAARE